MKDKKELTEYFDYEGIRRNKFNLSQDFLSSNPLRKCFDYTIGKSGDDDKNKKRRCCEKFQKKTWYKSGLKVTSLAKSFL